jgi:CHRD domain
VHARLTALTAGAILVLAATALASSASATSGTTVLKATLTGHYLHTTSTGSGTATITITPTQVCWKFSFHGIAKPGVSGIHVAPPAPHGRHTPSVLPFTATTSQTHQCELPTKWGGANGPKWVAKIVANPGRFFVIVGDDQGYPAGAIGGVLHAA